MVTVDGTVSECAEACVRKLVSQLVKASGVQFSLKTYRSTFAQDAKDHGFGIEEVSRSMRHKGSKATEAYYARIRPEAAFQGVAERLPQPRRAQVGSGRRRDNLPTG